MSWFLSICVCVRWKQSRGGNSVSKEHWFFSFLQPASAPSDISEILYSPEPIHRVMKARVPLWPLNSVCCMSQQWLQHHGIHTALLWYRSRCSIRSIPDLIFITSPLLSASACKDCIVLLAILFTSALFYAEALPFFRFSLLQPGLPCFAPSRSVPCSLPFIQRSPELGSAAGSEGEDTKAPKTVQKSQSVNLWRKHTPSSHSKDLNTHTHFRCRFGFVLENKALNKASFWD